MSRVITFSRVFPSYHPRAGQPTYFVEAIWRSLGLENSLNKFLPFVEAYNDLVSDDLDTLIDFEDLSPKHHTIRAGHRWKAGDWFSPRVWSGKPYNSKQIQFAPEIQVKKVFDFCVDLLSGEYRMSGHAIDVPRFKEIAKNDGLTANDLSDWFSQPMTGQIICWNESIEY